MTSMTRAALAIPVLLLVALIAGCGGRGSTTATGPAGGSAGSRADEKTSGGSTGSSDASPGSPLVAQQAAVTTAMTRSVISTGQLTLHSSSIDKARADVMRLVASWNGAVADEQTNSDDHGRIVDSTMTLRVPTARFSEAMTEIGRVGKVEQQSRKSEDVTTQVIDNDARVRAAERSIRQIEVLLGRARQLSDIIAIESDLARRQADLDSLRSQQAWLDDQTSLSTITVYLTRHGDRTPRTHEARGFLAGLEGGWSALEGATVLVLTAVGVVLPFAVLALLLGVPLWLVVRRRLGAGSISAESAPARSA